jgi:Kef-type K+ transport system membrane component KefB
MPSFGQLMVIVLAGLGGPLLAASGRIVIPVVVGELLAGIALGKTGAGLIKAGDPSISFLGDIGFACLMMVAGMHVPLSDRALTRSLGRGAVAVVASTVLGLGGGLAIAHGLGIGHPAVWAILLATGSAAIALPALDEAGVTGDWALLAMAWATVADVATIVAVPLVLNPSKALRAGLGVLAVAAGAVVVLGIAEVLSREREVRSLRRASATRAWALDLRFALLALFALCALAQWAGTSIMIAGFAAGLIVAVTGGPHRLSSQVTGVANGFLVPLFFVVLGASLNVRALVQTPSALELAGALIVGMALVHVLAGVVIRAPVWVALIVTAQLGVPAAVVKLGLSEGVLNPGQGAAIIIGALASLGICAGGTAIANAKAPAEAKRVPEHEHEHQHQHQRTQDHDHPGRRPSRGR